MILKAKAICKKFDALQVLKSIDLTIDKGEFVSIVGPSGAGKTTLLQILSTLDTPTSGTVEIDGQEITSLTEEQICKVRNGKLGFVFQFHQLLPEFTALENVMIPALIAGRDESSAKADATLLMDKLGLSARLNHKPNEMSGGEKQRTAVARALINHPMILFADEPTGSLDSKNRDELQQLFFRLRDELGLTIVAVTHDATLAGGSDRIITIKDGEIASDER